MVYLFHMKPAMVLTAFQVFIKLLCGDLFLFKSLRFIGFIYFIYFISGVLKIYV